MAESRLEMAFKNQLDTITRISVDSPRVDLTDVEVKAAMDSIIAKNIFTSTGGDLVGISGARIITTDVSELTIA